MSKAFDLFLISFLALFFEMLCIRWIPTNIKIFAYFTNIILISCFLGLGIGVARAGENSLKRMRYFPYLLAILVFIVALCGGAGLIPSLASNEDVLWSGFSDKTEHGPINYIVLLIIFSINTLTFIPLGEVVGKLMTNFRPIPAYSINIVGSIFGVVVFAFISLFNLEPIYWFGLGFLGSLFFIRNKKIFPMLPILGCIAFVLLLSVSIDSIDGQKTYWSPYYKIKVFPMETLGNEQVNGFRLMTDDITFQMAIDLSKNFTKNSSLYSYKLLYDMPYMFNEPEDVLIIGSGAGDDVSAALRNKNVESVDAVEIDPVILDIGTRMHPEKPYENEKVKAYVDDARSFIRKTDNKYDLIVFGFLDSHLLFSSMSNVRLDNYVYTIENFEEVKKHLKEGGAVAVSFTVRRDWVAGRLFRMLKEVFGESPLAYSTHSDAIGDTLFVVGPGIKGNNPTGLEPINTAIYSSEIDPSTDDWPYLYMQEKTIPENYLKTLSLLLVLSIGLIIVFLPGKIKNLNVHFFFLGSAFMLIEVKSITEIALLFGSTWVVSSIVISAILVMILFANYYVNSFKTKRIEFYYSLLFLSLIFNYLFPVNSFVFLGFLPKLTLSSFFVSIPLLFAGIIFAKSFRNTKNIPTAFGSNLIGAIVGGIFEYASLAYGLKSLYIVAILMYFISLISLRNKF